MWVGLVDVQQIVGWIFAHNGWLLISNRLQAEVTYVQANRYFFNSDNDNKENVGLFCYFHIPVITTSNKNEYCQIHIHFKS
jgi:hypothetical protein